jgi:hypothetical protein
MQSLSHYRNKFPQIGLALTLGFVLLVENVVVMVLATQQIQPSNSLLILYPLSICTILTLWVQHDSRSLGTSLGMDQSMYIFFGWPIMFPIYLFRSRGFRSGGLLLLLFLGMIVFAFIVALVITLILYTGMAIFSAA